jgi:hypothetical protein
MCILKLLANHYDYKKSSDSYYEKSVGSYTFLKALSRVLVKNKWVVRHESGQGNYIICTNITIFRSVGAQIDNKVKKRKRHLLGAGGVVYNLSNILLRYLNRCCSIIRMILAVIHSIGTGRAYAINTRTYRSYCVIIYLSATI